MAKQTKLNAGLTKRMESEKSILPKSTFQFNIGDECIYIGGIYEDYKGKRGNITKRQNKGHRIDYSVRFKDGHEINCILEKVLHKVIIEGEGTNED